MQNRVTGREVWTLLKVRVLYKTSKCQWLSHKESACNAKDAGSASGWGRSSGEENGNPLSYSCLRSSRDREAWSATVHRGCKRVRHSLATKQYLHMDKCKGSWLADKQKNTLSVLGTLGLFTRPPSFRPRWNSSAAPLKLGTATQFAWVRGMWEVTGVALLILVFTSLLSSGPDALSPRQIWSKSQK